jgi:hypothetical protein
MSAVGAALLAGCRSSPRRWVVTVACAAALMATAVAAGAALPALAVAPWLAIATVYSAFRDSSYHDLVAAGPRLAAVLRKVRRTTPSG